MKAIHALCGEYSEEDIYTNMDESGLCWRRGPSSGLFTQSRPGVKKDKSRFTLVVCTNSTALIGFLCGLFIEAVGGYWRSNKPAWMDSLFMRE